MTPQTAPKVPDLSECDHDENPSELVTECININIIVH